MALLYKLVAVHGMFMAAGGATGGAKPQQKASAWSSWTMWVMIAVMIVIFYFLLIRPQRKKAAEHDSMLGKVKKGDEIVTIGGIHGVVTKVLEDTIVVEVDKGVRMTFSKNAVSRRVVAEEEEEDEEEEPEEEEAEEEYEEEEVEEEEGPAEEEGEPPEEDAKGKE